MQQHATYINLRALGARTLLSENVAEWQFTSYTACNVFEITNSLKSLNLIVFFIQGATLRTRLNTRSKWFSLTFSMAQRLTKKCTEGWLFILQILYCQLFLFSQINASFSQISQNSRKVGTFIDPGYRKKHFAFCYFFLASTLWRTLELEGSCLTTRSTWRNTFAPPSWEGSAKWTRSGHRARWTG